VQWPLLKYSRTPIWNILVLKKKNFKWTIFFRWNFGKYINPIVFLNSKWA
jgi:hypothetical protein